MFLINKVNIQPSLVIRMAGQGDNDHAAEAAFALPMASPPRSVAATIPTAQSRGRPSRWRRQVALVRAAWSTQSTTMVL